MKSIRYGFFTVVLSLASVALHAMNEDAVRLNISDANPVYVDRATWHKTLRIFRMLGASRFPLGLVVLQKKCNGDPCTSTYDTILKEIGLMEADGSINEKIKNMAKFTIVESQEEEEKAVYVRESEFVEIPSFGRRSHVEYARPTVTTLGMIDMGGSTFDGEDESILEAVTVVRYRDYDDESDLLNKK